MQSWRKSSVLEKLQQVMLNDKIHLGKMEDKFTATAVWNTSDKFGEGK